jgi:hypothetical protein
LTSGIKEIQQVFLIIQELQWGLTHRELPLR